MHASHWAAAAESEPPTSRPDRIPRPAWHRIQALHPEAYTRPPTYCCTQGSSSLMIRFCKRGWRCASRHPPPVCLCRLSGQPSSTRFLSLPPPPHHHHHPTTTHPVPHLHPKTPKTSSAPPPPAQGIFLGIRGHTTNPLNRWFWWRKEARALANYCRCFDKLVEEQVRECSVLYNHHYYRTCNSVQAA